MKLKSLTIISATLLIAFSYSAQAQNKKDDKGRKQGHWVKTSQAGKKVYEGNFVDDYPVDTFYYYDKKGRVSLKNIFTNEGKDNYSILYHSNGKMKAEGNYIDKKKEGKWLYYNEKGKRITELFYKQNLKDGQEKVWDDDGKEVIEITTYKQGKKEGEFFKSLYSSGYYTCTYKNDKLNGTYKEHFPDKKIRVQGEYVDDNKQGEWLIYTSYGQVVQKLTYKDNVLVKDILVLHTDKGDIEISQDEIALLRPTGKQTQVIKTNSEKMACIQDFETLLNYVNAEKFYLMDAKSKIYVNISTIKGINQDGSLRTSVDFGFKIIPDKDGLQMVNTLIRKD